MQCTYLHLARFFLNAENVKVCLLGYARFQRPNVKQMQTARDTSKRSARRRKISHFLALVCAAFTPT